MKKRILATTTVLATLVGLGQIARADGGGRQFIPIEQLPPETRQQVSSTLLELTKGLKIDWDSVVVGVDENGQICLRAKSETSLPTVDGFSCGTSTGGKE